MFLLDTVCIEVRKNLQCANVFLRFHTPLTSELKISVEQKTLRVQEFETGHILEVDFGFFSTEAHTFTNLVVDKCNVSFRLSFVKLEEFNSDSCLAEKYDNTIKPSVEQGARTSISCVNCSCELTTEQVFNRILEFPSGGINLSEFFCHSHNLENDSLTLVPKSTELFYGFDFVVLNREILPQVREKDCHLYCQRCLQYLGETLFEGKAVKLWTDALWYKKYSANVAVIDEPFPKATPHSLFLKLIHDVSIHSSVEQMLYHQIQFAKVLIECSCPNRKKQFLLVHIIEREIAVFRNTIKHTDSELEESNNLFNIKLNPWKCFKLYYRCISESNEANTKQTDKVLDAWKIDISIHNLNISPRLFSLILKELTENSTLLPQIYRQCTDEFQLSFIFY